VGCKAIVALLVLNGQFVAYNKTDDIGKEILKWEEIT